jgi:C1A family cysteine protease
MFNNTIAVALAATMVLGTQIETDDYQFTLYMAQFNKNYQSLEEYSLRLIEFSKINQAITKFSSKPHTSWVTHNRFSDWTTAEREFLMGYHTSYREFRR